MGEGGIAGWRGGGEGAGEGEGAESAKNIGSDRIPVDTRSHFLLNKKKKI